MYRALIVVVFLTLGCLRPTIETADELGSGMVMQRCGAQTLTWDSIVPPPSEQWEFVHFEEGLLSGVVLSSDAQGAFYQSLLLGQEEGPMTLELKLSLTDNALFYPRGSRLIIDLKGLAIRRKEHRIQLGVYSSSYGNPLLAALPTPEAVRKLSACGISDLSPIRIDGVGALDTLWPGSWILWPRLKFKQLEVGLPFVAEKHNAGIRRLEDCEGSEVVLQYSGYESFADSLIPQGSGTVHGLLIESSPATIQLAHWSDLNMELERCEQPSTDDAAFFISEIADPDNDTKGRFIELFNAENKRLSLAGWSLQRYTNDAQEVSHRIDLSGIYASPRSTLVIAANAEGFEALFGFQPDLVAGSNSAANSNGDDTIALVNPSGQIVDLFGQIGIDGSGTAHEFEDRSALRKPTVDRGSRSFKPSEWTIHNDTGASGTIKQPLIAPQDFSPGTHLIE
jgi:hypothetical protein